MIYLNEYELSEATIGLIGQDLGIEVEYNEDIDSYANRVMDILYEKTRQIEIRQVERIQSGIECPVCGGKIL